MSVVTPDCPGLLSYAMLLIALFISFGVGVTPSSWQMLCWGGGVEYGRVNLDLAVEK